MVGFSMQIFRDVIKSYCFEIGISCSFCFVIGINSFDVFFYSDKLQYEEARRKDNSEIGVGEMVERMSSRRDLSSCREKRISKGSRCLKLSRRCYQLWW